MSSAQKKIVIVSVTNDLVSDYRVHKTCLTLTEMGYNVTLVGRRLSDSQPVERPYNTFRFKLLFNKKAFFYAEYNIRLFFYLLFKKSNLLISNDLDTLPANFFVSRIKRVPLLYDSHEYFTEVPELIHRPRIQKIWQRIEAFTVPKLPLAITVNESLAKLYSEKYHIPFFAIRNVPEIRQITELKESEVRSFFSEEVKYVLLYQGSLNISRGIETLIRSLTYLDSSFALLIIGTGDIEQDLKQLAHSLQLSQRVKFLGKIPFHQLKDYTSCAFLGFSLEENRGLNYYYALPNKLLDYIHAGVPVVCSPFPEMKAIIETFNVGMSIAINDEQQLATLIHQIASDETTYKQWKANCQLAASKLCWDEEKKLLKEILNKISYSFSHAR